MQAFYKSGSDCKDVIYYLCGCVSDRERELEARCYAAECLKWIFEGSDGCNSFQKEGLVERLNIQIPPRFELEAMAMLQRRVEDETEEGYMKYYASEALAAIRNFRPLGVEEDEED